MGFRSLQEKQRRVKISVGSSIQSKRKHSTLFENQTALYKALNMIQSNSSGFDEVKTTNQRTQGNPFDARINRHKKPTFKKHDTISFLRPENINAAMEPEIRTKRSKILEGSSYHLYSFVRRLDDSIRDTSKNYSTKELFSVKDILNNNRETLKQAHRLRYRENVFRGASRLTKGKSAYPDWVYQNKEIINQDIQKINVGGRIFLLFNDTLKNFPHSNLSSCILERTNIGIPFFDRDPKCFNAILNFYRTGRLHVPPNTCLTLYEGELEFWGVNELLIEPCCWSAFNTYKTATKTLTKFAENIDKTECFEDVSNTPFLKWRMELYYIMTNGHGNALARWMSTICTGSIVLSIVGLIMSSTNVGRVEISTGNIAQMLANETVSNFYMRTRIEGVLVLLEIIVSGFFLAELLIRLLILPKRLEFFSDTLNWVDLFATTTSLFSTFTLLNSTGGSIEAYVLLLKLPRILRLFKLTISLRSGMEAFTLTIKASAQELWLVFFMLIIGASLFGTLIFVTEMLNETNNTQSKIANAFQGVWFSIVTMSTVGYGDMHPHSYVGYLVTSFCILCGVIICQLPVPIFLMNFRVYHNQAKARLTRRKKLPVRLVDRESMRDVHIRDNHNS